MPGPVSSEPPWRPAFCEAAALGYRVAVVDTSARMLACANLADHVICEEEALLGDKWHEFVDPRDLPAVRAWFLPDFTTSVSASAQRGAGGREQKSGQAPGWQQPATVRPALCHGAPIHYRQLCQLDGRPVHCRITLVKVWCAGAWLAYGALRQLRSRPLLHGQRDQFLS